MRQGGCSKHSGMHRSKAVNKHEARPWAERDPGPMVDGLEDWGGLKPWVEWNESGRRYTYVFWRKETNTKKKLPLPLSKKTVPFPFYKLWPEMTSGGGPVVFSGDLNMSDTFFSKIFTYSPIIFLLELKSGLIIFKTKHQQSRSNLQNQAKKVKRKYLLLCS